MPPWSTGMIMLNLWVKYNASQLENAQYNCFKLKKTASARAKSSDIVNGVTVAT